MGRPMGIGAGRGSWDIPANFKQMAIVTDSFTDTAGTAITSHTAEVGGPWNFSNPGGFFANDCVISNANSLRGNGNDSIYYTTGTPAGTDYTVQGIIVQKSANTGQTAICIRMSTSVDTMYYVSYRNALGYFELRKVVSGSDTQLATYTTSLSNNTNYDVSLSVSGGANTLLTVTLGGSTVITYTDSSSPITSAGRPGVRFSGAATNTTGYHLDSFSATEISSGLPFFMQEVQTGGFQALSGGFQ